MIFCKTYQLLGKKFNIYLLALIIGGIAMIVFTNCTSNAVPSSEGISDKVINNNIKKDAEKQTGSTNIAENTAIEKVTELTDKNFNKTIKSGIVLVDFWASWCGPCRMQGPIIDELAKEMGNKVKITKLNVDQYNAISLEYNVKNIPTIIIFKDGKPVHRFVGLQKKEFLREQIQKLL